MYYQAQWQNRLVVSAKRASSVPSSGLTKVPREPCIASDACKYTV